MMELQSLFYIVSLLVAALAPSPLRPIFDAWLRDIQRQMGQEVIHTECDTVTDAEEETPPTEEETE